MYSFIFKKRVGCTALDGNNKIQEVSFLSESNKPIYYPSFMIISVLHFIIFLLSVILSENDLLFDV